MQIFKLTAIAATIIASMSLGAPLSKAEIEMLLNPRSGPEIMADCIAERCEYLNLDEKQVDDFSTLNGMSHVRYLMLSGSDLTDLSQISGLTGLVELHIRDTAVDDLSGISNFPNLRVLHVPDLTDTAAQKAVASLDDLTELAFDTTPGADLSFLGALEGLTTLAIYGGGIPSFAFLQKLQRLEVLSIHNQMLDDLTPILALPNLTYLMLDQYNDDQVQQIENMGVTFGPHVLVLC